jgi:hypothetical protein
MWPGDPDGRTDAEDTGDPADTGVHPGDEDIDGTEGELVPTTVDDSGDEATGDDGADEDILSG